MPRFISTGNPGEQAHGGVPHGPHPAGTPQFHAFHHPHPALHVVPPPPPHARGMGPLFELEESDLKILKEVYQNEDTVAAAMETLYESPCEIQLKIFQTLEIINLVLGILNLEPPCLPKVVSQDKTTGGVAMTRNFARWASPVLDDNAKALFMTTYGENGKSFIETLQGAPYEIGEDSTLSAYLKYIIVTHGKQNNEEN